MASPVTVVDENSYPVLAPRDVTVLTLTNATASLNSADQITTGRGMKLVLNLTNVTGTLQTLLLTIQGKDPSSGNYYTLLTSVSIVGAGMTVLDIYPGLIAAANVAANATLPRLWRASLTIGGTTPSFTGTIGASYIM